jgi:hypothetical protein
MSLKDSCHPSSIFLYDTIVSQPKFTAFWAQVFTALRFNRD